MNELMLLITLQRGNNHRPECTNPVGILAQTVTSVLNLGNNTGGVIVAGLQVRRLLVWIFVPDAAFFLRGGS